MDKIIEGVRQVFSKASVVVSDNGVSAIYTAKPELIVQEISDDDLVFLRSFMLSCDKVRFKAVRGKSFSVWFNTKTSADTTTFLQPLDGNITLDGLLSSLEGSEAEVSGDFIEFAFKSKMRWDAGVEEFINAVMEKTSEIRSESQMESDILRWGFLQSAVNDLSGIVKLNELDFAEPNKYRSGYVSFVITAESGGILMKGDGLKGFSDALERSSEFSLEIDIDSGETEVTFFA